MSLTVGTALKAAIEGLDLHIAVYDRLPKNVGPPYILIHDSIANPRDPRSASYATGGRKGVNTEVQVDLIQFARTNTDKQDRLADTVLPEVLAANLDGLDLSSSDTPGRIWACKLIDGPRELPNSRASNLLHHTIQLQVRRNLPTSMPT